MSLKNQSNRYRKNELNKNRRVYIASHHHTRNSFHFNLEGTEIIYSVGRIFYLMKCTENPIYLQSTLPNSTAFDQLSPGACTIQYRMNSYSTRKTHNLWQAMGLNKYIRTCVIIFVVISLLIHAMPSACEYLSGVICLVAHQVINDVWFVLRSSVFSCYI